MDKQHIYSKLPYSLKTLASSAWGYYLRYSRYGSETERLVEETLERDRWSRQHWTTWREERLAFILHHAATTVPYYRDQWHQRRKQGDRSSWELLENWPKLDKAVVRESPRQFISSKVSGKHLYVDHTSGTTGKPTLIFISHKKAREWFAIYEARIRRWAGLDYHERWGIFGGQKVIPLEQTRPPYWIWNKGLNQVYFSIFHITKESTSDYIKALHHYSPHYLIVYPSALSVLSRFILQSNLKPPKLKAIISNSEKLTLTYRRTIEEAFECPVLDTYGMAEMLSASSECSAGNMHFWPETGHIEIYDPLEGAFSCTHHSGLYCLTSLFSEDMPLIRYINGDMGSLPHWEAFCACGRTLPTLGPVNGRSNDLILTNDGRELYILDSLYNDLPIVEAQLIQLDLNKFEVNAVPDEGYSHQTVEKEIYSRLAQYLGEVNIKVNQVEEIQRDESGKFRSFISLINPIR